MNREDVLSEIVAWAESVVGRGVVTVEAHWERGEIQIVSATGETFVVTVRPANSDDATVTALRDLREACTDAYKTGRIPAEPFVRAGNALAKAEGK